MLAADGDVIGRIVLPETAANLCFGGHGHNRLFICASTSLDAVDVDTRGVELWPAAPVSRLPTGA